MGEAIHEHDEAFDRFLAKEPVRNSQKPEESDTAEQSGPETRDYDTMSVDELLDEASHHDKPSDMPPGLSRALWQVMYLRFREKFVVTEDDRRGLRVFRIVKGNQVSPITNDVDIVLQRAVTRDKDLVRISHVLRLSVKNFIERWKIKEPEVSILRYTVGDTGQWALFAGQTPNEGVVDVLEKGEVDDFSYTFWGDLIPHWADFLDRLSDPVAFCTWVWGVYSGEDKGRRAIWLYSAKCTSAEEGKSTAAGVIGLELFGHIYDSHLESKIPSGAYSIYNRTSASNRSQFQWAPHEFAAFTVYPDCKDTSFALTEQFRNLNSGGRDPISMEAKYKAAYGSVVNTRLLVHSNFPPHIKGERAVTSRLLPITIQPWNVDRMGHMPSAVLSDHFTKELPVFLALTKQLWNVHQEVKMSDGTHELIEELVASSNEITETQFYTHYSVSGSEDDYVDCTEVYENIGVKAKDRYATNDVVEWLKSQGVTKIRSRIAGEQKTRFHGLVISSGGAVASNTSRDKSNSKVTSLAAMKLKLKARGASNGERT